MILTSEKSDALGRDIRELVERGLTAKGVSARRASLDVVGNDGLIRDIRAGRIPSFDRLAALFDYLDIPFGFGVDQPKAAPGFADSAPGRDGTDLMRREALRAGFLPFPYHRSLDRAGTAPLAFSNAWLADNGLNPENLSFAAPDITMLRGAAGPNLLVLIAQNAPRTGNKVWCFVEGGKTTVARLHWADAQSLVISGDDPAQPPRALRGTDQAALTVLGQVVWVGHLWDEMGE